MYETSVSDRGLVAYRLAGMTCELVVQAAQVREHRRRTVEPMSSVWDAERQIERFRESFRTMDAMLNNYDAHRDMALPWIGEDGVAYMKQMGRLIHDWTYSLDRREYDDLDANAIEVLREFYLVAPRSSSPIGRAIFDLFRNWALTEEEREELDRQQAKKRAAEKRAQDGFVQYSEEYIAPLPIVTIPSDIATNQATYAARMLTR